MRARTLGLFTATSLLFGMPAAGRAQPRETRYGYNSRGDVAKIVELSGGKLRSKQTYTYQYH
jgi:Zn-dependent M16 (insulinase) family peptidase